MSKNYYIQTIYSIYNPQYNLYFPIHLLIKIIP